MALLIAAHFDRERSLKTYRIEMWLALAFGLGALRDGLWAAGMDIPEVNIIVLALGVAGSVCVYFWTQRSSLRIKAGRREPSQLFDAPRGTAQGKPTDQRDLKP